MQLTQIAGKNASESQLALVLLLDDEVEQIFLKRIVRRNKAKVNYTSENRSNIAIAL